MSLRTINTEYALLSMLFHCHDMSILCIISAVDASVLCSRCSDIQRILVFCICIIYKCMCLVCNLVSYRILSYHGTSSYIISYCILSSTMMSLFPCFNLLFRCCFPSLLHPLLHRLIVASVGSLVCDQMFARPLKEPWTCHNIGGYDRCCYVDTELHTL